jgi:glycosyltransferase involved in cell wall biosynthesis
VVNLSKASFGGGVTSAGRIAEVGTILGQVMRSVGSVDVVYFTISESVAGNLKDLLIYALCWRHLPRMVIHLHGGSIRSHIFDRHPVLRQLNAFFLRRIGTVIVLGATHLRVFEGLVPHERQHIVANFAQDYLFTDAEAIAQKFAATDVLHLLFLGNLIEGKGHGDLLAGYLLLPPEQQARVRLHFAGAFDSAEESAAFSATIARYPGITYHGVVGGTAKQALLAMAHLLVLPTSLSEGQPISILEAYAAGCVVMTTASGGIPDIFTDGVHGFGIRPNAPESVRDAIGKALHADRELGDIARRNWEEASVTYRTGAYSARVTALIEAAGEPVPVPAGAGS